MKKREKKSPVPALCSIGDTDPEEIVEGDVIAFYGGASGNRAEDRVDSAGSGVSIITHRVVSNSVIMGEFITRGDANEKEDINPVSYDNYIGKVQLSVPMAGYAAELFTSTQGKIAAVCVIAVAALLQVPAWRGRR